jgi:hypothetical protein
LNDVKEKDVRFQEVIGDHNHDLDNNRHSYTLGDHQRKYVTATSGSSTEMVQGWLYTSSITVLLVLTVGAYVKWKRNQLAKPA